MFNNKEKDREIFLLKHDIECLLWEWEEEKKLYSKKMMKQYYDQKVRFVIGELDLRKHRKINRPIFGLNQDDANTIAELTQKIVEGQGLQCVTGFHYREKDKCWIIDLDILDEVIKSGINGE